MEINLLEGVTGEKLSPKWFTGIKNNLAIQGSNINASNRDDIMGSIYASVAQLIRLLRLKPDDLNGLRFDEYLAQIEREGRQKFPDIDLAIQSSLAILDRVIAILEKGV